jgi:glycosyltransferase involved in cell wall biosynthesis
VRIGIDVRVAELTQEPTGVARYGHRLVEALVPKLDGDVLYLFSDSRLPHRLHSDGANLVRLGFPFHRGWQQVRLPLAAFTHKLDVLHSLNFATVRFCPCPQVVTIYDLSFLTYPSLTEPAVARYLYRVVPQAVERADIVLAISAFTAEELHQRLGVAREKIHVTPLGVDSRFAPVSGFNKPPASSNLPYVLYVGSVGLRKNLQTLIEAFAIIARQGFPHTLVLAGAEAYLGAEVKSAVRSHGLQDRVVLIGYVPDEDLPPLYSGASLFVFPSLYEGFGLPPLEAMACGTPVVCSNTSSLPEVVGDAALLVNPLDAEAMARAMATILENRQLADQLRKAGLARVRDFSWNSTADRTLKAYRSLLLNQEESGL